MVKLLLALLISFNCHAEWKVDIVNKHGNVMSQTLDTEAEANEYIAKVKHRWGREDGWYKKQCSDSLETREIEEITEYHCPKNYSAIISDITVEMDAKRAEKQAKKDERAQIKAILSSLKVPKTAAERTAWFTKATKIIKRLVKDSRD